MRLLVNVLAGELVEIEMVFIKSATLAVLLHFLRLPSSR